MRQEKFRNLVSVAGLNCPRIWPWSTVLATHNISFYFTIYNYFWYCYSKYGQVEISMQIAANLLIYILLQTIVGEGALPLPSREKQISPLLQCPNFLISEIVFEGSYIKRPTVRNLCLQNHISLLTVLLSIHYGLASHMYSTMDFNEKQITFDKEDENQWM